MEIKFWGAATCSLICAYVVAAHYVLWCAVRINSFFCLLLVKADPHGKIFTGQVKGALYGALGLGKNWRVRSADLVVVLLSMLNLDFYFGFLPSSNAEFFYVLFLNVLYILYIWYRVVLDSANEMIRWMIQSSPQKIYLCDLVIITIPRKNTT